MVSLPTTPTHFAAACNCDIIKKAVDIKRASVQDVYLETCHVFNLHVNCLQHIQANNNRFNHMQCLSPNLDYSHPPCSKLIALRPSTAAPPGQQRPLGQQATRPHRKDHLGHHAGRDAMRKKCRMTQDGMRIQCCWLFRILWFLTACLTCVTSPVHFETPPLHYRNVPDAYDCCEADIGYDCCELPT